MKIILVNSSNSHISHKTITFMSLVKQRKAIFATLTKFLRSQLKIKKPTVKLLWGITLQNTNSINRLLCSGCTFENDLQHYRNTYNSGKGCFQSHIKAIYTLFKKESAYKNNESSTLLLTQRSMFLNKRKIRTNLA